MISRTNSSNKQFIAVILFLVFIVISIISIAKFDSSNDPKKNNSNSNSNSNMGIDPNTPTVKESKPIVVVTSNNNTNSNIVSNTTSNKTSNKVSNKTSNKVSNITSNSNEIPVSYFITELSANKIYVAGSAKINVDIYPVNATNKKVKFKSTNTNVARVGDDGTIVGISEGVCYIDIEVEGGGSARVQIQVFNRESSNVTPTSNTTSNKPSNSNTNSNKPSNSNVNPTVDVIAVGLNYSDVSLDINKIIQLSTTIYPSNATNKTITWLSSSPSVATVSNGRVTAIKEGSTIITARSNNGKYATCRVTVTKPYTPPSDIAVTSLTPTDTSSFTMNQGLTRTIGVTISPSNATNKTITWSSSNSSIASVSGNGTSGNTATAKVTALAAGTATITARASNGVSTQYTVKVNTKNGWYTENGERVYYNNGTKLPKYGNFDYTLYGTTAWVSKLSSGEPYLCLNSEAKIQDGCNRLSPGTKVIITGNESNGYLPVKVVSSGATGYLYANGLFVNLPDLIPSNIIYKITNGSSSIFQVSDGKALGSETRYNISGVTGVNLYKNATSTNYGFGPFSNSKIGRSEYYVPLLYPTAKKLQNAVNSAKSQGYKFIIYDTYRPTGVEEYVKSKYMSQYQNHSSVTYDRNGQYWGWTWFMTGQGKVSAHSKGVAIDLALANSSGTELSAQSKMHTLDTSGLRKYNNANANKLSSFMTGAGFSTLESEWWHYQDNNFSSKLGENFKLN